MSTVTGTIGHGITLGPPSYDSPLTVTSTGAISNNGVGSAIYGTTGTVVNAGKLTATGASIFGHYDGIEIYGDGNVDNSGIIVAASNGISVYGVGSVTNSNTVSAQQWGVSGRTGFLTVTNNAGTIYGVDDGINLFGGGSVTNSGTIIGANGIGISGAAGTVVNTDSITGTYGTGIALTAGGSITNTAPGVISAGNVYTGIYFNGGAGTIVNSGTITGYAAVMFNGTYNDTLTDSGTIIGVGGTAVGFGGGDDLLQFQPGNLSIQGTVNGGGGTNTVEFASAASIGTLTGSGADFVNFSGVVVDTGASWVLAGAGVTLTTAGTFANNGMILLDSGMLSAGALTGSGAVTIGSGGTVSVLGTVAASQTIGFASASGQLTLGSPAIESGLIAGFVSGDTIDLTGVTNVTSTTLVNGDTLQIALSSGGPIDLLMSGDFTGDFFHHTLAGSDTVITENTLPCFVRGTLILTDHGEVAVETLAIGDRVMTLSGESQPIEWIGHRHVDLTRHPSPEQVWPVRIRAAAFADGAPASDLFVSPDHAVYVDEVLIPVKHLINGTTITRVPVDEVTYYHIELPRHDVMLARGLPVESYLDTGDRARFANGGGPVRLFPDFSVRMWEAYGCAPLIVSGMKLNAVRRHVTARATAMDRREAGALARKRPVVAARNRA
jgi:hypothetical protein